MLNFNRMKIHRIALLAPFFLFNLPAQSLYVPTGTSGIGSSNNSNVGIGTGSSPTLLGLYGTDPQKAPFSVDRYYDGARIHFRYGLNPIGGEIGMTYYTNGGVALWVGANLNSTGSGHASTPLQGASTAPSWIGVYDSYNDFFDLRRISPGGSAASLLRVAATGNVGIGTSAPATRLHVSGGNSSGVLIDAPVVPALKLKRTNDTSATGNVDWIGSSNTVGARIGVNDDIAGAMQFKLGGTGAVGDTRMIITSAGNVGVGTTSPSHKLAVNGAIRAKEVIVESTGWSDYVFADDYRLSPLSEVEKHIKSNGHLPGIPSASEVAQQGVSLGEMQSKLLAKIEELTLHLIAQEKEIASVKRENEGLMSRLTRLERN